MCKIASDKKCSIHYFIRPRLVLRVDLSGANKNFLLDVLNWGMDHWSPFPTGMAGFQDKIQVPLVTCPATWQPQSAETDKETTRDGCPGNNPAAISPSFKYLWRPGQPNLSWIWIFNLGFDVWVNKILLWPKLYKVWFLLLKPVLMTIMKIV